MPPRADPTRLRLKLPKTRILRRNQDFERVLYRGRRLRSGCLSVYFAPGPEERRVAFITSGKFPSNVKRNLVRRRLREVYRCSQDSVKPGFDVVIRADARALDLSFADLKQTLLGLLVQVGA